jgi:signal transduction histidine kinase
MPAWLSRAIQTLPRRTDIPREVTRRPHARRRGLRAATLMNTEWSAFLRPDRLRPARLWVARGVRHPGQQARRLLVRPPVADAAIALGLAAAFSEPGLNPYHHDSGSWWAAGGIAAAAALAWRRSRPVAVWLVATVISIWLLVTRRGADWGGLSPLVVLPSPLLALFTVAEREAREHSQLTLTGSAVMLLAGLLAQPVRPEAIATAAALLAMVWALGDSRRSRQAGITALRGRAAALEAERAERDRRAAADERSRIARDLHDIVAHHVSVITLQAGTARLLAESGHPPEPALLAGIETAGRQAMAELRDALGVIRHAPGGASPLPGLAQLPQLVERITGSGLEVTASGTAGPLPAAADLAAYRIIQEGLTNVLRHSTARTARVALERHPGRVEVRVRDDGPAHRAGSGDGSGYGLIGLRERVAALGGSVSAGTRPGGGFELCAALPLAAPADPAEPPIAPAEPPAVAAETLAAAKPSTAPAH